MRLSGSLPNFFLIISFVLIIYLVSLSALVYNLPFYSFLFEKTGVKLSQAAVVNNELIAYFKSSDSSIPSISLFSANENSHMRDVKFVIKLFFSLLYFISAIFIAGFCFAKNKLKILLLGSVASALLPLFLFLFSFAGSFTLFHKIFFPQGNWSFPPDALIVNIYTFEFFRLFMFEILVVGEFISAAVFFGCLLFLAKSSDNAS